MAAGNKLLLALASFLLCYATTSMAAEFIINSTDGMIYMDSFVAHEDFYSSLQELTRHKVRSAIDDLVARSKVDVTQLVPNMDVAEYTIFQMLHSLVHDDLSYFYQLVESLRYRPAEEHFDFRSRAGAFSKSMRSNISYSPSEMYKVAKSLINVEQSRFKTIDKLIVKGIFLIMNKSEIFKESSRRGDIEVMKWILSSENCLDLSSALDTACRQKKFDIVRLLIENDKSNQLRIIDMTNCSKETLLQIAVQTKSRHFVSLLIRSGVSVNVQDPNGLSPLYLAVKNENLDMSRLLIENGADVNLEAVDGSTALHEAVRSGMADMAELLIGSGSIPQCKDRYGINPMMMLEKYVITNIARYLLHNKVNIPEDDLRCSLYFMLPDGGWEGSSNPHRQIIEHKDILRNSQLYDRMKSRVLRSPCKEEGIRAKLLNITMINLITPFVQSLLNLGVPLDAGSKDTEEAFLNAIEKGNIEMTTFLINKGVSVNMTKDGLSTLHIALINRHKKIFYLLVDRGADILAVTSRGRSLLHSACEGQQKAEVEYLIKRGLNVNATDSSSVTPLQVAASTGNYDVITTLVKYGANVRFRSTTTPLIAASISGNVKAVNFLIDNGADIEEKANFKMTPLIAAVNTGNEDMVEALLNRGASVHAKEDSRGDTALHIAAKKGYLKIVEMLLKRGHNKEIRNSDGRTALDLAVARRDSSIISALAKA